MVIFRTPEGKPGYQQAETIEEAVEVVERLRNDDGVDNVRIFRLDEVSFEYKPYYKVEISTGSSTTESTSSPEVDSGEGDGFGSTESETSFDRMAAETDSIETSASDSEHSDHQPSWDAPPPPPPAGVFGGDHNAGSVDDGELTESGTARRGLFGR
ncbi:MAG: hypothetical protein ACXIVQ_05880 [Acidimicrobiales bacterium]